MDLSNFDAGLPSLITERIAWVNEAAHGTFCGDLQLKLLRFDLRQGWFEMEANTTETMRNVIGTLHGGSAAMLADQAMGCVANCLFPGDSHAPTSQLSMNFHRPIPAGQQSLLCRVYVVNTSRSQIHLRSEICMMDAPDKLCVSAAAMFSRSKKEEQA